MSRSGIVLQARHIAAKRQGRPPSAVRSPGSTQISVPAAAGNVIRIEGHDAVRGAGRGQPAGRLTGNPGRLGGDLAPRELCRVTLWVLRAALGLIPKLVPRGARSRRRVIVCTAMFSAVTTAQTHTSGV